MPHRALIRPLAPLVLLALAGACQPAEESDDASHDGARPGAADRAAAPDSRDRRPETRTGTVGIEGMDHPIALRLFRSPDGFPLPFSAYVPEDMEASAPSERTVQVTAEFGGVRNEDAFLHLYVFPEATTRAEALAHAHGYKTGRGLPVSQGLEPLADELRPPQLDWALEAYRFRYQSGGTWYGGALGVGRHAGRFFMIVRHLPAEYGDGFNPRAGLVLDSWRWADGSPLRETAAPPAIVEDSGG